MSRPRASLPWLAWRALALAVVLAAVWPWPVLASPVGEVLDIPLLAEHWRRPPGDPRLLPPPGSGTLRLSYDGYNVYRHSQQGAPTQLQRLRGPALTVAYNDWDGFFSLEARDYAVAAGWEDSWPPSRLDGAQDDLRLDFGTRIPLSENERLVLAGRLERGNLALSGVLPSALARVPGFSGQDAVRLGWDDENWLAALRYEFPGGALHASYGERAMVAALQALSDQDDLACRLPIGGRGWSGGLEGSIEQRAAGELFASRLRADGSGRVYHHGSDIGLLEAEHQAQQLGVRIRDPHSARRWDFSVVAGKYSAALAGSARLSGFDGSVWGITAPRGHLAARLRYRAVTARLDRMGGSQGGCDWRWNLGVTRFDLDSRIDTWGTVLFGAARVDESSRSLPMEAGWIGHAGLSASWELGDGTLTAALSQSVPFSVYTTAPDDDLPPVKESTDGGRVISIAYIMRF